ncbi:MAG TPA: MFS transporter [Symbiobacteriaceae bacterium]
MDRRKQTIMWAVFAANLAVRVGFGGILPILPIYAQQHGLSTFMIAVMTNAYLLSNVLFQSPAGHLGDRVGRRPVMLAGTWLYTVAAALFLLDGGPWYYVALRAVEGLGASAFGPTARAYVADLVPREQRGRAFGMFNAFDMAGILIGPMVGGLAEAVGGPRAPFAVCALLGLVAGVPLMLLARPAGKAADAELAAAQLPAATVGTGRILRSPAFWAVAMPQFGFAYLNALYSVVWSLYMQRVGATPWQISLSFTLFAVPMVALTVPFGALADRVSKPLLVATGGTISALTTLAYGIFPNPNALIGFGVIDGAASAMFSPASQAFMADVTPDRIRGRFTGLVGSVGTAATILFATAIGYMYERTSAMLLFALGALALAFGCGSAVMLMVRFEVTALREALERNLD